MKKSGITVAIANQKGGVGKTTMTLQIAYVAIEKGLRVLVVDMDGQGNASQKLATQEQLAEPSYTKTYELFSEESDAEIKVIKNESGIDLLPANTNDHVLYNMEASPHEHIIRPRAHLDKIRDNYDLILIDCPPSLGRLLLSCLTMAQFVITPVAVSGFAISGVKGLVEVMEQVKASVNPELQLAGIFVNNYNSRSKEDQESVKELREQVGGLLFKQIVSRRAPIDQAVNRAKPVWKIRSGSATPAAKEIRNIATEVLTRVGLAK